MSKKYAVLSTLDGRRKAKLFRLHEELEMSLSDVVRLAIDHYHEKVFGVGATSTDRASAKREDSDFGSLLQTEGASPMVKAADHER